MPSSQSKLIEQKTCTPALFDIPVMTGRAGLFSIKNPVIEKGIDKGKIDIDEKTLNTIFLDKKEETKLQKAKKILGEEIDGVPDDELGVYIAEFQFLLDSWLDEYEKQIFDGKTLRQLTKEGQNGTISSR